MQASNYFFNSFAIESLQEIFENGIGQVEVSSLAQDSLDWIGLAHEMMVAGSICACIYTDEDLSFLEERLTSLSMVGVDRIKLIGTTRSVLEALLQCRKIDAVHHLGLTFIFGIIDTLC